MPIKIQFDTVDEMVEFQASAGRVFQMNAEAVFGVMQQAKTRLRSGQFTIEPEQPPALPPPPQYALPPAQPTYQPPLLPPPPIDYNAPITVPHVTAQTEPIAKPNRWHPQTTTERVAKAIVECILITAITAGIGYVALKWGWPQLQNLLSPTEQTTTQGENNAQ